MSDLSTSPVIFWFRRDLRLDDNAGLAEAIQSGRKVIPVFVFDPAILNSPRIGPPRLKFMLHALESLRAELRNLGHDLLIRYGSPQTVLAQLVHESGATGLYFNRDYTPYARQRDDAVKAAISCQVHSFDDRLLAPPGAVLKNDGNSYSIYTPFKNKWRELPKPSPVTHCSITRDTFHDLAGIRNAPLAMLQDLVFSKTIDVPPASAQAATSRLMRFMDDFAFSYAQQRDILGNPETDPRSGTSFLSPYVRFGLLSPRQIYEAAQLALDNATTESQRKSLTTFIDEIIWHEFYTHVLWFNPQVKTQNFNRKYDAVQWRDDPDGLQAWKDGMTGFPVVDAAMRQLKATGWMHNRARMIVASFLTKDLLIDWRAGELHFMQWLIDGDLAANNGGWQWAAGTGTDAQPYFRIFNPVSQSKKSDPNGDFIRCWIPELRDVPDQLIHTPWEFHTPPAHYPPPIVDHPAARKRALDAFAVIKST